MEQGSCSCGKDGIAMYGILLSRSLRSLPMCVLGEEEMLENDEGVHSFRWCPGAKNFRDANTPRESVAEGLTCLCL